MAEFNGWEKIERIGGGGQSTVYLVRSPQRAEQRRELLRSLETFSNGAKHPEYAAATYDINRPELLNELGALKIFTIRPDSGKPVDRLKREIEILKDARPNLPRLIDSNPDKL